MMMAAWGPKLTLNNGTVNGNIGVGSTGNATVDHPMVINGEIDFAAANKGQFTSSGNVTITGGVNYSVAAVTSALSTASAISSTLGGENWNGMSISLSGNQTLNINASSGKLDASGDRVFDITHFNTTNGNVITITGDAAGDNVVLNFGSLSANFNNQVVLAGGLTADQVLYNFSGGGTLQINDNASASSANSIYGDFFDLNGTVSADNSTIDGRVFGGGECQSFQCVSGTTINAPNPGGGGGPGTNFPEPDR